MYGPNHEPLNIYAFLHVSELILLKQNKFLGNTSIVIFNSLFSLNQLYHYIWKRVVKLSKVDITAINNKNL